METRLIDANALKESELARLIDHYLSLSTNLNIELLLKYAPTVDAVPVKRGHWEREDGEYGSYVLCSECGLNLNVSDYEKQEWREILRFCPFCGADMRGKRND